MATLDTRWKLVPGTSPYHVFTEPIEKPAQDNRAYRLVRLANGLEALLIHDKDADTSAAAMDIAVGHLNDPDDMPGLAHFCEHMLFLGTKQFPKENGYNEYISAHGGHANAFTGASNTNYYFSVSSTATSPPSSGTSTPVPPGASTPVPRASPLPRALEMFASFFHAPLFSPAGTARELNAVDSEHKKNAQSDRWRIFQLYKSLSSDIEGPDGVKRRHPWAKFGTGHRGTLSAYGRSLAGAAEANGDALPNGKGNTLPNGNGNALHKGNGNALPNGNGNALPNGNGNALPDDTIKPNGILHGSPVVDPAHPLPALTSEADPDGGPVGRATRHRLVEWWEREYCAGRMRLAVLGRESLDELTQLATTLFAPVVNRGQDPAPLITVSPLGPAEQGTITETKTVMDFRALDLAFHLPWQLPQYRTKPAGFIAHLIGHEGPGSVHSYLKQKGWATGVSAGASTLGRGFSKFGVQVMLTKEGLENYETVLLTLYKYLALLRASPLEPYHHAEIRALGEIEFRFTEKERAEDYVSGLAGSLNKPYAREHVLSGATRVWEWDEPAVRALLDAFRPERSRVTVMAREFEGGGWRNETWYGTEYRVRKIEETLLEKAQTPNDIPELFLPGPNAFIPANLDVQKVPIEEPAKRPVRIRDTPLASLWHKKDDQFWVPKASFNAYIITPLAQLTPRHALKSRMYTELVNDALTEYAYDASLAGLSYACGSYDRGVFVAASGYNDKIPILFRTVLEKMKNIKIDPARFAVIKEDLKQDYENFYLNEPYRISDYWTSYLLAESEWTPREKLAELETVTVEEVQAHIGQLLSRIYIEALATGNIREEEATGLLGLAEKVLDGRPLTPSEKMTDRSLILPQGCNYVYKSDVPNPKEVNSSLAYYCHIGHIAQRKLRALNSLLLHMMREPAFDELRTKQQLGYVVFVTRWEARGALGLRFLLQSERAPAVLEARVEAFLEAYRMQLAQTLEEEFVRQKEGLISKKLEKLENMYSETSRFWGHITSGYCDFVRHEDDVEELRGMTLDDVVAFFDTYVHPASAERRKLSVHLRAQRVPGMRFSVAASEAYLTLLKTHGVPVEEAQYRALSKAEPPVEAVTAFWTDQLVKTPPTSAGKEELLKAIGELAREHPIASTGADADTELRKGAVIIEDVARFKAGLTLGPAAVPVQATERSRL